MPASSPTSTPQSLPDANAFAAKDRGRPVPIHARCRRRVRALWPVVVAIALAGLGAGSARASDEAATNRTDAGGTLRLCVDAQGRREYRDTACGAGQRQLRSLAFERGTPDPALLARSREIEREMDRRNTAAPGRSARSTTPRGAARGARSPDPCAAAKQRRDRAHQTADRGLSFDRLRKLDRDVWFRCKNG